MYTGLVTLKLHSSEHALRLVIDWSLIPDRSYCAMHDNITLVASSFTSNSMGPTNRVSRVGSQSVLVLALTPQSVLR